MQITVIRKSDNSVITRIFEDEEGIKEITDDDYEVLIEKANSLADELASKVKTDPDELKVLAKPLQDYLARHFNPMCSVVVDVDRVTVVSKELSTPTD